MTLNLFQVDAFAKKLFAGNPAAVCPLEKWLPDSILQAVAMENNLAETAFYVKEQEGLRIRWFTPTVEVDLCGHATLATAFVLFFQENYPGDKIVFNSKSGPLSVTKDGDLLTLDFPADELTEMDLPGELKDAFGVRPLRAFRGKFDCLVVFENEDAIKNIVPDLRAIGKVQARGIIATAKGDSVDFVSRFFAPQSGVPEDPVTGSAHTSLVPYWAGILGKNVLTAVQLSARQGHLVCKFRGDRVDISGTGKLFMKGQIFLES